MEFEELIRNAGRGLEGVGVAVIVTGALISTVRFVMALSRGTQLEEAYRSYRRWLARSILLGLEFLVAGDIIRTVAIEPSFQSVGVLAIIVAIRTFLSVELEMEIEGRWPWQRRKPSAQTDSASS